MKFYIKDFFNKCDQIRSFRRIWSHLRKESLILNPFLCSDDEFIGLKDMPCTNADSILAEIKDVLLRMNLKLNKFRGQCYDGCSTISGLKNGIVVQIKVEEKCALYAHCYTHSINLAIGDTMKNFDLLKHTIDNTLVKKFSKRDAKLNKIKNSLADEESDENFFGCKQELNLQYRCFVQP